ncbi:Clan SB, family S8, subtilisin-like serine peptidase [Trichomonas vaginalis G3]|uniref:Clan SB, family S8, subtilisin-like serine peptidase n=1 Tax=Trichomonas vaginalis (strain ATCC PRA-98 / G3) TaxID=412133 RepID=A2EDZ8_TRIV3|nr:proprotein convertase subtilisin/kexin-related family [Trichomonas vaginalis G3]EAY09110.1 Clan SB, family S8, subtilisin-like serine peptidase [Trichomonas vaginalis G3]KAI5502658.1 proprotein convertase subtilisin/kexin-related family [Trichomonas vaginalis G3]|eukprot:XP_001321333.1 Clan SB, family S8, subtilisin-like serine peptidase [Trichomonas vaginalis G3]
MFFYFVFLRRVFPNIEKGARKLLSSSSSSGWHYIHILDEINLNSKKKLSIPNISDIFSYENQQAPDLYLAYLSEKVYNHLKKHKNLEIIHAEKDISCNYSNYPAVVKACDSWNPKNSFSKLAKNIFLINSIENVETLKDDECVLSCRYVPYREFHNRYSTGYIQSGKNELSYIDATSYVVPKTLNQDNINGKDQIITFVDKLLDYNHDLLTDSANPIDGSINQTNLNHRKIVRIDKLPTSTIDTTTGHGTHTSTISSGESQTTTSVTSLYNGIAPKSKIYFVDINLLDTKSTENLPFYLQTMKELGSGISSNSWGYSEYFPELTQYYDNIAYQNQNILFTFSAGNNGGSVSINSPGDSKNVLTVGASSAPSIANIENGQISYFLTDGTHSIPVQSVPSHSIPLLTRDSPLVSYKDLQISTTAADGVCISENTDVCSDLEAAITANSRLFVYSGSFCQTAQNNAIAAVEINSNDVSTLKTFSSVTLTIKTSNLTTISMYQNSCRGPTKNGIAKPEIVAPGENIISGLPGATGNSFSALTARSGTSMSVALISGAASLIRQYFMESKYDSKAITPSSALIKAVLANGAVQIPSISSVSSTISGYGIPNLSKSFGIHSSTSNSKRLLSENGEISEDEENIMRYQRKPLESDTPSVYFVDNVNIASDSSHVYSIMITNSSQNLSITMSYTDAPVDANYPLYADISIYLEKDSLKYVGNDLANFSEERASTTERIIVQNPAVGQYKLHVFSNEFNLDGSTFQISYSLAISGCFSEVTKLTQSECPKNCQGTCQGTKCICDSSHLGYFCQTEAPFAKVNKSFLTTSYPRVFKFFRASIPENSNWTAKVTCSNTINARLCICGRSITKYCFCNRFNTKSDIELYENKQLTEVFIAVQTFSENNETIKFFNGDITLADKDDPDDTNSTDKVINGNLPTGSIIGIIAAVVVLIGIIVGLVIYLWKKKMSDKKVEASIDDDFNNNNDIQAKLDSIFK